MKVSFSSFNQNYSYLNKIQNNVATTPSFKGNESKAELPSGEYYSATFHPAFALQMQLLKDGYTLEEIKEHQVFNYIDFSNINFSDPDLVEKAQSGEIRKEDILIHPSKSMADVYALQKAYALLRQKFNSEDVQKFIEKMRKLEDELNEIFINMGHEPTKRRTTVNGMILHTLHYVDKTNVGLLNELLDDKNFDNTHISTALMKLNKNKDSKYGLQVLKMAQEVGYNKEFSNALAVLISEAEEFNMPIIEKMLGEQEFLSENSGFVCERMMSFLRGSDPELALSYLTYDDITLNEVNELLISSYSED